MSYDTAKAAFADWGVDTEAALECLNTIPISMHCWQGDDVVGFEQKSGTSGGGQSHSSQSPCRTAPTDFSQARNLGELQQTATSKGMPPSDNGRLTSAP